MADKVDGVKYRDNSQPREVFLESIRGFYDKIHSRDWWQKSDEQRQIAIEALGQDYLRTNHEGHIEEDADTLMAALDEYHMRLKIILMHSAREV